MKNIKIEWCENWIRAKFAKVHAVAGPAGGIETSLFWRMAEAAGLYEHGTYNTPMTRALEKLCRIEDVYNAEGNQVLYSAFKLKEARA